jgi:CheY-like chemotaxis protein
MTVPCMARVLIVENDQKARTQLVEILSRPGYMVLAAEGQGFVLREEAKRLAGNFKPHVVIMDLRLLHEEYDADRSGLELLKEECFSSSRCILHSAYLKYDYKVTRDALVEARVADVVGKEEDPRRLINAVDKAAREGCVCCREFTIEWPHGWDERRVVKTLFGEETDLPKDIVTDILGHLFSDARVITLKTLKGTDHSSSSVFRGRSVLFQVWTDKNEPVVIKLAPRERTDKEVTAYKENIRNRLVGRFYAQLEDHRTFWDLGGICYSFIGSSLKTIATFADFYQQRSAEEVVKPLRHFFEEVWSRPYADSRDALQGSLYEAYDSLLKLGERMKHVDRIAADTLPGRVPNPLRWILEKKDQSLIPTAMQAVTHGDLHGDNLFVEEEHAWAIDFERSKSGPILRDFVELEVDIVTRLVVLPTGDLLIFKELADLLCKPATPTASLLPAEYQNKEVLKCLEVVQALRSMALKMTDYSDMREYYWGLLFDTIFSVLSAEKETEKWWRGLVFASALCDRLEYWESD